MSIRPLSDKLPKSNNPFTKMVGRLILFVTGWRIEGELPNIPKFVALGGPHTSNWDFIYAISFIFSVGLKSYWMGKHTLFKWPYGWFMRALGGIPIERNAPHGVVAQMVDQFNQREQLVVLIPPEGTRKKVKKWKTGFYFIAKEAGVPILPTYLDYERKVVGVAELIIPGDDVEADIAKIQDFYRKIPGKYPQ
ncbi:lysophospholipid acyltransferase family protein [Anaerolineales bacterium HSG6]|nr:lysophospholipid acyltransferase family protein [Anaerolineales bacterium HSG6]